MANAKTFGSRLCGFFAALVQERAVATPRLETELKLRNR